jgi:hypothetical protein
VYELDLLESVCDFSLEVTEKLKQGQIDRVFS